jgi:hypothetical protein
MGLEARFELSLEDNLNKNKLRVTGAVTTAAAIASVAYAELIQRTLEKMRLELEAKAFDNYGEVADAAARLIVSMDQYANVGYSFNEAGTAFVAHPAIPAGAFERLRKALRVLDLPNSKQRYGA